MTFKATVLHTNPRHSCIQIRDSTGALCGEVTVNAEDAKDFLKHFEPCPDPEWADALEITFDCLKLAVGEEYSPGAQKDMDRLLDKIRTGEWWR